MSDISFSGSVVSMPDHFLTQGFPGDPGQLSRLVPVIRIMAAGEEIHQRGLHGRNVQCAGEKENGKEQDRHPQRCHA